MSLRLVSLRSPRLLPCVVLAGILCLTKVLAAGNTPRNARAPSPLLFALWGPSHRPREGHEGGAGLPRCSLLVPARRAQAASIKVSSGRRSPLSELLCVGEVSGSGDAAGLKQPLRRPGQPDPPATAIPLPVQSDVPPPSPGQAGSQVQRPRAPEGASVQQKTTNTKGGRNGDGKRGFDAGFKQRQRPEQLSKIRDRSVRPCRELKMELLH